jgi:hypothetical protein
VVEAWCAKKTNRGRRPEKNAVRPKCYGLSVLEAIE